MWTALKDIPVLPARSALHAASHFCVCAAGRRTSAEGFANAGQASSHRTASFLSLKGGAGKTTLCLNVAVAEARSEKVQICHFGRLWSARASKPRHDGIGL
jgi:Flp pilus assembly CpaE family ATPase